VSLKFGDVGPDVAEWQRYLWQRDMDEDRLLEVTGTFDHHTERATRAFQMNFGIEPTGTLCAETEYTAILQGWRRSKS